MGGEGWTDSDLSLHRLRNLTTSSRRGGKNRHACVGCISGRVRVMASLVQHYTLSDHCKLILLI